jgi:monoamine oxidase
VWPAVVSSPEFKPQDYAIADGKAVKFLSAFEGKFFTGSPNALWDQIGNVWESTHGQPGKGFGLSVFSGGGYALASTQYPPRMETLFRGYGKAVKREELVDWSTRPWIKSGYSVPAVGQVTTIAKNLSTPHLGRLFFAGEHASPGFHGFMEGALQSGLFTSYRIVAAAQAALGLKGAQR